MEVSLLPSRAVRLPPLAPAFVRQLVAWSVSVTSHKSELSNSNFPPQNRPTFVCLACKKKLCQTHRLRHLTHRTPRRFETRAKDYCVISFCVVIYRPCGPQKAVRRADIDFTEFDFYVALNVCVFLGKKIFCD